MDDRVHVVSDEDFIAAVVEQANDLAWRVERSPELLRAWASLCDLPESGDTGPAFWEGFVLGSAVTELEIAGFARRLQKERAAPVLRLLRGGKDEGVGKKCPS